MLHHIMIQIMEENVNNLFQDLHVLRHMLKMDNKSITITYDEGGLVVYLPTAYKAYIPKKFNGVNVRVVERDGEPLLTLDTIIKL